MGPIEFAIVARIGWLLFDGRWGGPPSFGGAVAMGLLGTGILKREDFDLFFWIKHKRRAAEIRAAAVRIGDRPPSSDLGIDARDDGGEEPTTVLAVTPIGKKPRAVAFRAAVHVVDGVLVHA